MFPHLFENYALDKLMDKRFSDMSAHNQELGLVIEVEIGSLLIVLIIRSGDRLLLIGVKRHHLKECRR